MPAAAPAFPISTKRLWAGRIISAVPLLFLLMDAVLKLVKPDFVVQTTVKLGYPESTIVGLGITLLVCVILFAIPRTAVLGAILLTGYLGGAVATHVRIGDPLFSPCPVSNLPRSVHLGRACVTERAGARATSSTKLKTRF